MKMGKRNCFHLIPGTIETFKNGGKGDKGVMEG
jgi:hypothetical protein